MPSKSETRTADGALVSQEWYDDNGAPISAIAGAAQAVDDASVAAFIVARAPTVIAKAKAIMADPAGAPDFTAAETKVIKALAVLDLARRYR